MSAIQNAIANATSGSTPTSTKGTKPIGYVNVKIDDTILFSKPVWAESESKDPVLNDLNEFIKADPEKASELFLALLKDAATVEVNMVEQRESSATLAKALAGLMK